MANQENVMIKKIFKHFDQILTKISIFFIKIYQYTISPDKWIFSSVLKGTICAHHPHCSEYSVRTLKRYGFISWIWKVMNRVTSCTPSNSIKYDPEHYKVVFFSSAPIGVPFLEALHEDKRFEITGVVTNPDQKSGRGMKMKENIIKTVGKEIWGQTDDKINIINYNTKYKKEIALLYDKCFNNQKFWVGYNYDYFYNNIDRRSSWKGSYIGKILLKDDKFAWYFQAYKTEDMEWYLNRTFWISNISKLFNKECIDLKKEVYRLDDIIITHKERGKWYFNMLLDDLYNEVNKRNKNIVAIYTTKDLVEKYRKRNFKIIWKVYSQKDKVSYYIMVKNINKKTIPNLLVLHGYNSSANQNFFQNLKQKTEKLGIRTTILNLPNKSNPSIPEQTKYVLENYDFDENTIILGHSLGSIIGLNTLQHIDTKIKQYISVAGFLTNNLTLNREYFQTFDFKLDKKKILWNLSEKSIIIYDPKDKNIPVKQAELLEEYFSTTKITLPTQKPHFMWEQEENLCEYVSKKIGEKQKQEKIILLHWKDTNSQEKWYPRVKEEIEKNWYTVECPDLPNAKDPDIKERLKEIDKLQPNKETIIIGHSRGGVAILRRLEQHKQLVKKVILIGTNDWKSKYIAHWENNKGFYTANGYDFEKIKKYCNDFVVFHSKDDKRVDYKYWLNNTQWLNAKLNSFEDKNHFWWNEKYWYKATTFPQLVNEVYYSDPYHTFIQTPNSLRLDSKKYAEEAHNFKLRLEAKNPDYLVVIAYGKIIPQYILDIPNLAPINIHGSLLPKYRGASPIQSVFLNKEKETGITIMKIDATMDTGNMIDKKKFKIAFTDTVLEVIENMKKLWPKFLTKTLWNYGKDLLWEEKQDNSKAIYCEKIEKSEWEINPYTDTLEDIYAKYRAYFLRPKIYFKHEKSWTEITCTIDSLILDEEKFAETKTQSLIISPIGGGTKGGLLNPAIQEIKIKPEGKKSMDWKSFVNGYLK